MLTSECLACLSNSGVRRISPAPPIFEGLHWQVEHAYPVTMTGWVVIVLKRHARALHELVPEEWAEFGLLLPRVVGAMRATTGSVREYVSIYGEKPGFDHVHVHVIERAAELLPEEYGTRIFARARIAPDQAIAHEAIIDFCDQFRSCLAESG